MKTLNKAYKASSLLCSSIGSSQGIHVKEKALRMKPITFNAFVLPSMRDLSNEENYFCRNILRTQLE